MKALSCHQYKSNSVIKVESVVYIVLHWARLDGLRLHGKHAKVCVEGRPHSFGHLVYLPLLYSIAKRVKKYYLMLLTHVDVCVQVHCVLWRASYMCTDVLIWQLVCTNVT